MNRRQAILASALLTGGLTNQVKAQDKLLTVRTPTLADFKTELAFDLDSFKSYTFSLGAEKLTFTPVELMAALQPCQHEPFGYVPSEDAVSFMWHGKRIEFCHKCGQVYEEKR